MNVIARSSAGLHRLAEHQRDSEHRDGSRDHADRVALFDFLDEKLGAGFGRLACLDQRGDSRDHRVARRAGRPGPAAPRCH